MMQKFPSSMSVRDPVAGSQQDPVSVGVFPLDRLHRGLPSRVVVRIATDHIAQTNAVGISRPTAREVLMAAPTVICVAGDRIDRAAHSLGIEVEKRPPNRRSGIDRRRQQG